MRRPLAGFAVALAALVPTGCDLSLTVPDEERLEAGPVAAAVVHDARHLLFTAEGVRLRTLDALATGAKHVTAEAFLLDAADLLIEARLARATDELVLAEMLERWAETMRLEAALGALGPGVASEVVLGALITLGRLERDLRDLQLPPWLRELLVLAREEVRTANQELFTGDTIAALVAGTSAAAILQGIDAEERATEALARAFALLERAGASTGAHAPAEIRDALEGAKDQCDLAQQAFGREHWHQSTGHAQACAGLADRVLVALFAGVSTEVLRTRAQAVVAQAAELHARALELAPGSPHEDRVRDPVHRAGTLLTGAQAALAAGRWPDATQLGTESVLISGRAVFLLARVGPDQEELQLRSSVAIRDAEALHAQARALAGSDPSPQVSQRLSRAGSTIIQAWAVWQGGDWQRAIVHATEATLILSRLIRNLS